MKKLFFLLVVCLFFSIKQDVTYAKDCTSDIHCPEGKYCKGGGSIVSTCTDCQAECNGSQWCEFWCKITSSFEDCDELITIGECQPGAIIFKDANFQGVSQGLSVGKYDIDRISIGNDTLSSLKVPSGWKVTLYMDHHFSGYTKVFTGNTAFVGDDFNDQTSSIVVGQGPRVIIYQHANYGGYSQALGPGRYDLSEISIGNDTVSSLKIPHGWRVILYKNIHFLGEKKVCTESTEFIGNDFNDQASSIIVED